MIFDATSSELRREETLEFVRKELPIGI